MSPLCQSLAFTHTHKHVLRYLYTYTHSPTHMNPHAYIRVLHTYVYSHICEHIYTHTTHTCKTRFIFSYVLTTVSIKYCHNTQRQKYLDNHNTKMSQRKSGNTWRPSGICFQRIIYISPCTSISLPLLLLPYKHAMVVFSSEGSPSSWALGPHLCFLCPESPFLPMPAACQRGNRPSYLFRGLC